MSITGFRELCSATIILLLGAVGLFSQGIYIGSGFLMLSTIFLIYRTERVANKKGLDRDRKVIMPLLKNTVFLSLVGLAAVLSTVPGYLSVIVITSFSLLILTKLSLREKLNRSYTLKFGYTEIGIAGSASVLLSGINFYFGFYCALLIVTLSGYQLIELVYRSIDLKSRI